MDPTTLNVAKIVITLILTMVALCVVLRLMTGERGDEPTYIPPPRRLPVVSPLQSGRDRNRPCKCGSGHKFKYCCWGAVR